VTVPALVTATAFVTGAVWYKTAEFDNQFKKNRLSF